MSTEATSQDSMISLYSDWYKDAYGVRPRLNYDWFRGLSEEAQQAELDRLKAVWQENNVRYQDLRYTVCKYSGWRKDPDGYWVEVFLKLTCNPYPLW